jgi:hypothetical protein
LPRRFYDKARALCCAATRAQPCEQRVAPGNAAEPASDATRLLSAQAVNCCTELRQILDSGPDGGYCPPLGECRDFPGDCECRGFPGDCAELPKLFETLAVLPDYPNGLQDWTCHAFPDDDKPLDSFIVGLISIASAWLRQGRMRTAAPPRGLTRALPLRHPAVAIPVTHFLANCFEIANDTEAPDSWLEWVRALVLAAC